MNYYTFQINMESNHHIPIFILQKSKTIKSPTSKFSLYDKQEISIETILLRK